MKDRMERLVVLPFSIGCVSQSSVAVIGNHPKKTKPESNPSVIRGQKGEESLSVEKMKNSFGFLALPKPNISTGLQRLIKNFKSFSHFFEVEEMEMEIGLPTDVKHVTHIGWDGSTTTNPIKGWDNLQAPELLSIPSISLRQFELAMAAQVNEPLVICTSKLS
ncbi:hypothetical protein HHK36_027250 [Tetracentron sinense]|uniref:CRIB domain-containing protein n=1 Tax=Tetracentron sinense TaxID=13715 RepID=A0A834YL20_TETSI|nr:hypothetical protein HHK36_027250 [Tetracentron sinense]